MIKAFICWMAHHRHHSRWERWFCHTYYRSCSKCGRNMYTQNP